MKVKEFSFVCYPITNVKRARAFYEGVLGLRKATAWISKEYAFIEYEFGPDTLCIGMGAPNFRPGKQGPTAALEVDDFDGFMKKLKSSGVKFLMEKQDTPICYMALVEDPDGNQIMIHHRKPQNERKGAK